MHKKDRYIWLASGIFAFAILIAVAFLTIAEKKRARELIASHEIEEDEPVATNNDEPVKATA